LILRIYLSSTSPGIGMLLPSVGQDRRKSPEKWHALQDLNMRVEVYKPNLSV
jgi:hypothetical protein